MKPIALGEVIAERMLDLKGSPPVAVRIGRPLPFDGGGNWYCPFTIEGLSGNKLRYAAGVDAVQALQLAQGMIGAVLYTSAACRRGMLGWEGGSDGDLGFPEP